MSVTIVIENPDGVPSIGLDNREKIANNLMGIETHALNNQLLEKIFLLEKIRKIKIMDRFIKMQMVFLKRLVVII